MANFALKKVIAPISKTHAAYKEIFLLDKNSLPRFQGVVKSQDFILGTFTLNNVTIHCVYKFVNNDKSFVIPPLNEKVRLDGVTKINNQNVVLTKNTNITFFGFKSSLRAFSHNIKFCKTFVNLVRKYKLKPCDIVYIASVKYPFYYSEKFLKERACKTLLPGLTKHLTVSTVEYLLNHLCKNQNQVENCDSSTFKTKLMGFKIYGLEHFKIGTNFLKRESIYWHYGIELGKKFQLLTCFLKVESTLGGFLMLQNEQYKMACIILKEDISDFSKRVEKILNKFVLIHKYRVITEYYNDFIPVQYLVVNIRDIFVQETGDFVRYSPTSETNFWKSDNKNIDNFNIIFHVLHRSAVKTIGSKLKFTLHCIVLSHDNLECVLQFTSPLAENYLQFNDNDIFKLQTKNRSLRHDIESRKTGNNITINKRTIPSFNVPCYDTEFVFQSNAEYTGPERLFVRSVKGATDILKNTLSCNQDISLISFEGVLVERKFLDPFSKPTKASNSNVFGTPGSKVHQLILQEIETEPENESSVVKSFVAFENTEEVEKQYKKAVLASTKSEKPVKISVYLHNWESLQCPLGLIPGMTLHIKYVVKQKDKYYKAIHNLTSIEVVKYDASLDFETCYSFLNNENWGPSYPLGLGQNVATNCLCQSRPEIIEIKLLKFDTFCNNCKEEVVEKGKYCSCEARDLTLNMLLILYVTDEGGKSDVVVKNDNLLRQLLQQRENEWDLMKLAFLNLRRFKFSISDTEDKDIPSEIYENAFKYYFRAWNAMGIHDFRFKCRKMDKNVNDNNNNPKWFLLEVEEIHS